MDINGDIMSNYTILHCHTMLSNATTTIDSVTHFNDYIEKAKKCGMKAMGISEHGSVMEWYHKKCAIENAGMKYIHASEVYVTKTLEEKVRDNYHCLLIAKNYDGVKELNRMISKSFNRNDGHYYYSPRITYDELKATTDNLIVSTACLGGILNSDDVELRQDFGNWLVEHKDRCYLEIQHHNVREQIEYNKKLVKLHKQFGIPLLATTDTHSLDKRHERGRGILQVAKDIRFENEDGWDLCFRTYDELSSAFLAQGLEHSIVVEALENTNRIADLVEDFELDKGTKYPKIYDDSENVFKSKINDGYKNNKYIREYPKAQIFDMIHEEFDTYKKTGSIDFMLLQTYLREWEKENGVQCGYGRGSVSGSIIAYLLGITQMNSVKFGLNFFRFMNPDRVSNADIDTDYSEKDRAKVKRFLLQDHLNLDNINCSEIITFNTIATKGAIKDVARAMEMPASEAQEISNQIIDDIIPDELRKQYPELFEYVDIVSGTIMSIGSHPSGVLVTDEDISSNIGTCTLATSEYPVSMLNMKELDDLMYVKLDILGLDGCGVINETCRLAGIERLTPDNVNLEDEEVWKSIRDDTTLIFQWESESAQAYLKKFMSDETIASVKRYIPDFSYIKWFSFGNGLIRPACASYRDEVANGIFATNGLKELDDFLAPTMGRVAMQEDIMQFLVKFCGYSQAESDIVRRGIAKKKGTEKLLPEIERRFIEYTKEHYNVPESKSAEVIKPFLQTILDASSYAFSWNHSDAYSCIGYINGYLRYYYPLEFLTSAFNTFSDNAVKTQAITQYAKKRGINIKAPKFGHSQNVYVCDKETNTIYKGLDSIKSMQTIAADIMNEIYAQEPKDFIDVLFLCESVKIDGKRINSKSMDILVDIGFFSEYGNINTLKRIRYWYDKFAKRKTIKKDDCEDWLIDIIRPNAGKETEKQFSDINKPQLLRDIDNVLPPQDDNIQLLIKKQIELLGYVDVENHQVDMDEYIVQKVHKDKWGRIWLDLFHLSSNQSFEYKCEAKWYNRLPCVQNDLLKVAFRSKEKVKLVGEDANGKKQWMKSGEFENIVNCYEIIKE